MALSLEDWILGLLAYAGGRLEGVTRLQKGLFLVWANYPSLVPADFRPHKYGPFSRDIYDALDRLEEDGLLRVLGDGESDSKKVIVLTEKGRRIAQESLEKLQKLPEWDNIEKFFKLATRGQLMALLSLVYTLYPEWTRNSEIKQQVSLWRRFFQI